MGVKGNSICLLAGHVLVDQDDSCLRCGKAVLPDDSVSVHINRDHGGLEHPDSIARIDGPDSWGHCG